MPDLPPCCFSGTLVPVVVREPVHLAQDRTFTMLSHELGVETWTASSLFRLQRFCRRTAISFVNMTEFLVPGEEDLESFIMLNEIQKQVIETWFSFCTDDIKVCNAWLLFSCLVLNWLFM